MRAGRSTLKKETPTISFISNLIGSNSILLVSVVTSIVINRGLGPEYKGVYTSLRLVPTLFAPMFMFGYTGGILYYSLRKIIDIRKFFLTGILTVSLVGVLTVGVLYLLIVNGVFGDILQNADRRAIWIIVLSTPLVFLNAYLERVFYSHKLFRPTNIRNVVAIVFILLSLSILWVTGHLTLLTAISVVASSIVLNLVLNWSFVIRLVDFERKIYLNRVFFPWRYGIKSFLNQLIAKSNDKFDQIILGFLMSPASFGIYTAGVALGGMVAGIPGSYANVFFSQIANADPDEALQLYKRAMRTILYATLALGLMVLVFAKYIILILYGDEYIDSATVIMFYMPGVVFQVAARLSIKFYAANGKPLKNSLIYAVAIAVSSPFYFLLIPSFGLKGAAISSSLSYLMAFLISTYQLKRDYPFKWSEILILRSNDITDLVKIIKGLKSRK